MSTVPNLSEFPIEADSTELDEYVRLTAKGQRLAKQLRNMTPREQERTMQKLIKRARMKEHAAIVEKKRTIITLLRGDEPVLVQTVCERADVTIEEFMLLVFHINDFVIRLEDARDDRTFIELFFNGTSGEVWAELYEPDRKI